MSKNPLHQNLLGQGGSAEDFEDTIREAGALAREAIYGAYGHSRSSVAEPTQGVRAKDIELSRPLGSLHHALEELRPLWLEQAVYYHHERYLSHLNCPVAIPAVAAEVLATSLNTAVETWDQAGPAAEIEQCLIRWISSRLGLPDSANGVFTSGGTQSNLQGLAIARNKARRIAKLSGEQTPTRLAVFTSTGTHYSLRRAADMLGFDDDSVISVPADEHGAIKPKELEKAVTTAIDDGFFPAAVLATAGATDRGTIDPLADIATICSAHGIHLHVDAAYAGVCCVSAENKHRLRGIEGADTITIDFHKTFYQPLACSAVLVRDYNDLSYITKNASYLNPADEPRLNLADFSLQTSRRFDALKLWLTLRTVGEKAIGEAFDTCVRTAGEIGELIDSDSRFDLFEKPQLSTVLFSLSSDPNGELSAELRDELFDSGTAAIAVTRFEQRRLMKMTILDPSLEVAVVADLLNEITATAERLSTSQ